MSDASTHQADVLRLGPFDRRCADVIARWADTPERLRLLAPGTDSPLTAEKVVGWVRPNGHALTLVRGGESRPIGYGELNPMRVERDHFWVGHVVLDPRERGRGLGRSFVRGLVSHGFDRLGAKKLSLIVFPENAPAIRCYRGVGFVQVGEEYHDFKRNGERSRLLRFEITRLERKPCR